MTRLVIGAVAMLAVIVAAYGWHRIELSRAVAEGQMSERLIWQERQARAEIEAEAARKSTQEMIARIEADYWQRQAGQAETVAELEKALADEKASADPACGPVVSKRVRDQLDRVGR